MAMRTGGGDELNSEINVTPMVDVMLVLLIIFMITAPLINNTAVDLDLPQVKSQPIDDKEGKLALKIDPTGKLKLGQGSEGTAILWADLGAKLKANAKIQREKALYIAADQHLPYGVVITAMAIAKNAGVDKVLMLTDPNATMKAEDLDKSLPK
jgi:biopolymer transport protein TolR